MTQPRTQELTPLHPDEIDRLRAEYDRLPVHDPRRRLLAAYDALRMEYNVTRRVLGETNAENLQMRAQLDEGQRT